MCENCEFSPRSIIYFLNYDGYDDESAGIDAEDLASKREFEYKLYDVIQKYNNIPHKLWIETDIKRLVLSRKIWFLSQALFTNSPFTHINEEIEALVESILNDVRDLRDQSELSRDFRHYLNNFTDSQNIKDEKYD
jgi:hypothetical protein